MKVKIKRVGKHDLPLPKYETAGASGMDLRAARFAGGFEGRTHPTKRVIMSCTEIRPGERASFGCGFAFSVPPGFEVQVRGRSGLGSKGVVLVNGIGTGDSDYRGELLIGLHNVGTTLFTIWEGDRIAQAVIAPVVRAELEEVDELESTERGANGHGSTGVR